MEILCFGRWADFDANGVLNSPSVFDVCVIGLAGPVSDPDQVCAGVVVASRFGLWFHGIDDRLPTNGRSIGVARSLELPSQSFFVDE